MPGYSVGVHSLHYTGIIIINAGIINNVDYRSDFDLLAEGPSESTSQGSGQFESGNDASAASGMYTCTCTHIHMYTYMHMLMFILPCYWLAVMCRLLFFFFGVLQL